jgi:hypothetical protein
VAVAALRLARLRAFVERSASPMQMRVDGLASEPEKLQTIRSEFEAPALQVAASDGE